VFLPVPTPLHAHPTPRDASQRADRFIADRPRRASSRILAVTRATEANSSLEKLENNNRFRNRKQQPGFRREPSDPDRPRRPPPRRADRRPRVFTARASVRASDGTGKPRNDTNPKNGKIEKSQNAPALGSLCATNCPSYALPRCHCNACARCVTACSDTSSNRKRAYACAPSVDIPSVRCAPFSAAAHARVHAHSLSHITNCLHIQFTLRRCTFFHPSTLKYIDRVFFAMFEMCVSVRFSIETY